MSAILEVKNVSKFFTTLNNKKLSILNNVSFDLQKGESLAIVGSSGSGKSTLLSLISGLDTADIGDILIDGQNISSMSEEEISLFRSKTIGIIFQHFYLINHLSALENVTLPMEFLNMKNYKQQAQQLLNEVNMNDRLSHHPKHLSGGEMQRVAIARALAIRPQLLIADEPTGNLDNETAKIISDLLFQLIKEHSMSTIIVTHSQELANKCDRSLTLKNGKLS